MQLYSGGQGVVGPSDQTTPRTPHTASLLSTEQSTTCSVTPSRLAKGASDFDQRITDHVEEGVEAWFGTNVDVEETFPTFSHVTNTGSTVTTFLVNEELVPIKIKKILGNYRLFNLVFII